MASITKKLGRYYVRVRRKGSRTLCKSFGRREDALRWSRQTEIDLENGLIPQSSYLFLDIINRYEKTVSVDKKSHEIEKFRLKGLKQSFLSELPIHNITQSHIAQYRDNRLELVQPSTVLRELTLLSHIFTVAMQDWGYELTCNPVSKIRKPPPSSSRNRRLEEGEEEKLLHGLNQITNIWTKPLMLFAIETAMRRGELLKLQWQYVFLEKKYVHLPETKNGATRNVPLSPKAEVRGSNPLECAINLLIYSYIYDFFDFSLLSKNFSFDTDLTQ
ncbi:MAG: integrase [Rhodospirillaceae bacterium]|nr:integrase [Rhodospirillaceae bacterium]